MWHWTLTSDGQGRIQSEDGSWEGAGGGTQGLLGRVVAGEVPEQRLEGTVPAEPLKIADEGKAAISQTGPAEADSLWQPHLHDHGLLVTREARQVTSPDRTMTQSLQAAGQQVGVVQHRWQDGEMGHGPMADMEDLSDRGLAIQWPIAQTGPMLHAPGGRLRLGVMASGSGTNFETLVARCRDGSLPAEVTLLIVNQPGCGAVDRARRLGIRWRLLEHRHYPSRQALDRDLCDSFRATAVDLVVMAGWMRVVTSTLIDAFPERLVNIHPSLLPSFRGIDAVGQALAAGVTITGCTSHLVSEEVDAGRILVQAAVPVLAGDDRARLTARIRVQEHRILPVGVALAAQRLGLLAAHG